MHNRGGTIGICFCSPFLKEQGKATAVDVVKHITYIVDLVGIDYVSLGSDFDGVEDNDKLADITKVSDIVNVIQKLEELGYLKEDIDKILGYNLLRVI